jgi:hypothetical protein
VARSLRELGRLDEAVLELELTVESAADAMRESPRYRATHAAARAELEELEPRVGRLTVVVEPRPVGLRVHVGERALPAEALGLALPVQPGRVEVRAEAPGHEELRTTVELRAGEARTASLALVARRTSTPVPASGDESLRVGGGIALGLGALGVGLFAVVAPLAGERFGALQRECMGRCPLDRVGEIDAWESLELGAHVGLGLGLASLALGAVLLVVAELRAPERPSLSLGLGPGTARLRAAF